MSGQASLIPCPKCNGNRVHIIDFDKFFHCWDCRLVGKVSDL